MSLFDSLNHNSSEAVDIGKKYVETTKEYYKLKLFQQTTNAFSFLSKMAVIGGLLFLGLIFNFLKILISKKDVSFMS